MNVNQTPLLAAEERAEYLLLAEGVFDWDAVKYLQLVEVEEAAMDGEHIDLGLTEKERAAALIFRDDQLRVAQLNAAAAEIYQRGKKLDAMSTPKSAHASTGFLAFNFPNTSN